MERSLWPIMREAKRERERERERRAERKVRHTDERERKKKRDKMTKRREKIIKNLIFPYSIFGCTVLSLEWNYSYVPNVLAFGTPDKNALRVQ